MQWEIYQNQYGVITSATIQTPNITARVELKAAQWVVWLKCGKIDTGRVLKAIPSLEMDKVLYEAAEVVGSIITAEIENEAVQMANAVKSSREDITWRRHVE